MGTKIKPLYVDWNPQKDDVAALKKLLASGLEDYRADYEKYYEKSKHANSPKMRDPNPTVILIPLPRQRTSGSLLAAWQ